MLTCIRDRLIERGVVCLLRLFVCLLVSQTCYG
jgi:hypothetical protein